MANLIALVPPFIPARALISSRTASRVVFNTASRQVRYKVISMARTESVEGEVGSKAPNFTARYAYAYADMQKHGCPL